MTTGTASRAGALTFPAKRYVRLVPTGWRCSTLPSVGRGQAAAPSWVQPPVLQGGQLRLEWVGGTLQTATNVPGTWSDMPGAVSPYLQPATNPAQFFRVKQ